MVWIVKVPVPAASGIASIEVIELNCEIRAFLTFFTVINPTTRGSETKPLNPWR
jgi:hypothetical protein